MSQSHEMRMNEPSPQSSQPSLEESPGKSLDESPAAVIAATRKWVQRAVVGLNLCPFARAPLVQQRLRFQVSGATGVDDLLEDLCEELRMLQAADAASCESTLLMHPGVLQDFLDFNDFLDDADAALRALGLKGEIQIASFHPDYRFAGSRPEDIENYTNRSPYPTLHLLRESSIERALESMSENGSAADDIYERNIETLRRLGHEGWRALWQDGRDGQDAPEAP